jgi:hypothetical protein
MTQAKCVRWFAEITYVHVPLVGKNVRPSP